MDDIKLRSMPCDRCMTSAGPGNCTHRHLEPLGSGQQAWYPKEHRIGAWRFFTDTTRWGYHRGATLVINGETKIHLSLDYDGNMSVWALGIEEFNVPSDVLKTLRFM